MKRGQSVLEYVLIITVVATALMVMRVYVQRSLNAQIRTIEEQVNPESQ